MQRLQSPSFGIFGANQKLYPKLKEVRRNENGKKKLADLKRPERNVRMHTDKQIKEFRRSLEMFGQIRPIVIDENNVMLAGNGLYETMLTMDYKEADCYVVTGLSENEKKNLCLRTTVYLIWE